jgi:hypothetical protein
MSEGQRIVRSTEERAADPPFPAAMAVTPRHRVRPISSPHSHKFRAVTAALGGVAAGAIVVAIAVLAGGRSSAPSAPWSSWAPDDHASLGIREIADHVAPLYRISPVDQLAVVTVVSTANASAASSTTAASGSSGSGLQVAVRTDPTSSAVSVLTGKTVAYNLCGIGGSNCSIGVGTPSADRLLLLRREALELALYTFRYISGVDNVVAILPPGHTTETSTLSPKPPSTNASPKPLNVALLFLHAELQPWLSQPLGATLPEQFPPSVAQMHGAPEAGLVEQITARGMFSQRLVQAQDGSNLIVLDTLPPQ